MFAKLFDLGVRSEALSCALPSLSVSDWLLVEGCETCKDSTAEDMRVATVTIEEDGVRLAPLDPPELRERQTLAFPASDRELPPLVESPARGDGLKVLLGTDLTDTLVGKLLELSIVFGFGWETAPIFDDPRGCGS